jgi:hypothetical protein
MPYTPEQLANNSYFEKVLESNRKEQVDSFLREKLKTDASGSNAAASETIRMKTGEFVSIPELEDAGSTSQQVTISNRTRHISSDEKVFVDKEIKELLNNEPAKVLSVEEFFTEYERLKTVMSAEGNRDSHRYLVDTSKTFINTDDDEVAKLKARLQEELDKLQAIQKRLEETTSSIIEEAESEATEDAAYELYYSTMSSQFLNTARPYTRQEWDAHGMPEAAENNGWGKLRFIKDAAGNYKGSTHNKNRISVTYYGYGRKKNKKVRSGNQYLEASVEAVGDPHLTYDWVDNKTGVSLQYDSDADHFSGIDTPTLSIAQGSKYKHSFGCPTFKCKIKDSSGEVFSKSVDIYRRTIVGGS